MTQVIITQMNKIQFLLIYEEDILVECHPLGRNTSMQIGDIYVGRVEKVVKNIQSAFIRLDGVNVGYLPLNDKPVIVLNRVLPKGLSSLAENDQILVQVEQEPQKMKQARVTGNISLGGKYVVLDLAEGCIGVSKKIRNMTRIRELKNLLCEKEASEPIKDMLQDGVRENCLDRAKKYGCIFRTSCENADNREIIEEYKILAGKLDSLLNKAAYKKNTGCIREGKQEYRAILEEYGVNRIKAVKTDLPEIAEQLNGLIPDIIFYNDSSYPLYKLLSLEKEIGKLLNKKVWLKSGGFLIIEPTEAMIVIDVNSGKAIGKKKMETHIFEINMEAAREIIKQIRLRNLSGIIMIDFINMENEEYKQKIVRVLETGLKQDKVPGYFIEITKLDLFELTRKKIRKPLHEILDYKDFSYGDFS